MNVNLDQLLAIIGGKEVELSLLKNENAELRKRLSDAEARLAEKPNTEIGKVAMRANVIP